MSKHQKSISAPKKFPIKRKDMKWTIKPSPGPHPQDDCVPLGIIVRDVLKHAESVKEVKKVLHQGKCKVDGKTVKDHRYPLGLFDSLKLGRDFYKILPSKEGFKIVEIDEDQAKRKLCKIQDKKMIKGGQIQLNLNDGKNILAPDKELEEVKTGSSLLLSLPENEVKDVFEKENGCKVMITQGKNRGKVAEIEEIKNGKGSDPNRAIVQTENKKIDLPEELIFPCGEECIPKGSD